MKIDLITAADEKTEVYFYLHRFAANNKTLVPEIEHIYKGIFCFDSKEYFRFYSFPQILTCEGFKTVGCPHFDYHNLEYYTTLEDVLKQFYFDNIGKWKINYAKS